MDKFSLSVLGDINPVGVNERTSRESKVFQNHDDHFREVT